jgi:hypothetical protein
MRQAGEPDKCGEATDVAASPSCSSPIQVFLTPLNKKPGDAGYVEPEEDRPPPDSVRMTFAAPPDSGGTWTVREEGGRTLCELPCSRWIKRSGGYTLQHDKDSGVEVVRIPKVEYAPGRRVNVSMLEPRGSKGLGIAATIIGGVGILAGATGAFLGADSGEAVPGLAVAGGSAAVLTTGIVVLVYSRSGHKLELKVGGGNEAAAATPKVSFGPTGVAGAF